MPSVAKELFNNRYWMKVEERAFYTDEWLAEVGVMGVTTIEDTELLMNSMRQVKITIPMLADFHRKGYKLAFINASDIGPMFNIIDTHLENWVRHTNSFGFISTIPPIEDFELLDNLAEVLFPFREIKHEITGLLSLFLAPTQGGNMAFTAGLYSRRAPLLFPYCKQVHG